MKVEKEKRKNIFFSWCSPKCIGTSVRWIFLSILILSFVLLGSIHWHLRSELLSSSSSTDTNAATTTTKTNTKKKKTNNNKPLNVLLLYPDDWRHDSIGGVGPVVQTPFLNSLAQEGIRFTHNCVTTSICWISRATLFTGQYGSRHQSIRLTTPNFYNYWKQSSWPALLQQKGGYFVGHVGKWQYINPHGTVESFFNYTYLFEGQHWHENPAAIAYEAALRRREKQQQQQQRNNHNHRRRQQEQQQQQHDELLLSKPPPPSMIHATDLATQQAIHFLKNERPKDRPFALTVAFFPPKALYGTQPWNPKNSSMDLYQKDYIPEPKSSIDSLPYFFRDGYDNFGKMRFRDRFADNDDNNNNPNITTAANNNNNNKNNGKHDRYQQQMKNYYRLITEVDDACKQIVQVLKDEGILDDTLVIFTTDNGYFHGEHGLAGKWYPYQESIRVPLIIRDPRMPVQKRNTLDDSFTLNIDLASTILGAAGIQPHLSMQGRDIAELYLQPQQQPQQSSSSLSLLSSLLQSSSSSSSTHSSSSSSSSSKLLPWRDEFYYEFKFDKWGPLMPICSALVRKRMKYIYWPQYQYEQLFDLLQDPLELHDVANETSYANMLSFMRMRHDQLERTVF